MTLSWFTVIDPRLLCHLCVPLLFIHFCPPIWLPSEPVQVHDGKLSLPLDPPGSPVLSDEEYLSPIEEGMELDDASWSHKTVVSPFREPPSFQVLRTLSSALLGLFRKRIFFLFSFFFFCTSINVC